MSEAYDDLAEVSEAELIEFLALRTREHWDLKHYPYLLSLSSPDLKKTGRKYSAVIGESTLSKWADGVEQKHFTVVRHPIHKAKVGLIPFGEQFSFEDIVVERHGDENAAIPKKSRPLVIRFLEALGRLSDEDIATVQIPTRIIVKMMQQ